MNLAEHQRSTSRRRDQLKCYRCRQDKQKCSPTERDWTTRRQEKCKRCQTAGYECGPPETSARKHRFKKTTPEGSPKPIACAPKFAPHVMSLSLEQGRVQSPVLVATTASARVPCTEHIQQVVWDIGGPDTISLDAAMNLLATSLALQRLLFRCQLDSQKLDEKFALLEESNQDRAFQGLQSLLRKDSQKMVSNAQLQIKLLDAGKRKTAEMKLELWQYMDRTVQWQRRMRASPETIRLEDADTFAPMAGSTLHEFNVLLCTEYVLLGDQNVAIHATSDQPTSRAQNEDYEAASMEIQNYMTRVIAKVAGSSFENCNCGLGREFLDSVREGFPACHIAFWNHDKVIARNLWKVGRKHNRQRDVLDRSFAHIVTEAEDLGTLRYIGQECPDSEAICNAGFDHHSRSLLAIAALLGNRDAFAIIADRCADRNPLSLKGDTNVLACAARGGSAAIMRMILKENMVPPPYTSAIEDAILSGHTSAAEVLLDWIVVEYRSWHSYESISRLAKLAAKHNQPILERKLINMSYPLVTGAQSESHAANSWAQVCDRATPVWPGADTWSAGSSWSDFSPYHGMTGNFHSQLGTVTGGGIVSCPIDYNSELMAVSPTLMELYQEPLSITTSNAKMSSRVFSLDY